MFSPVSAKTMVLWYSSRKNECVKRRILMSTRNWSPVLIHVPLNPFFCSLPIHQQRITHAGGTGCTHCRQGPETLLLHPSFFCGCKSSSHLSKMQWACMPSFPTCVVCAHYTIFSLFFEQRWVFDQEFRPGHLVVDTCLAAFLFHQDLGLRIEEGAPYATPVMEAGHTCWSWRQNTHRPLFHELVYVSCFRRVHPLQNVYPSLPFELLAPCIRYYQPGGENPYLARRIF